MNTEPAPAALERTHAPLDSDDEMVGEGAQMKPKTRNPLSRSCNTGRRGGWSHHGGDIWNIATRRLIGNC